jgi:hypothetical protein
LGCAQIILSCKQVLAGKKTTTLAKLTQKPKIKKMKNTGKFFPVIAASLI